MRAPITAKLRWVFFEGDPILHINNNDTLIGGGFWKGWRFTFECSSGMLGDLSERIVPFSGPC